MISKEALETMLYFSKINMGKVTIDRDYIYATSINFKSLGIYLCSEDDGINIEEFRFVNIKDFLEDLKDLKEYNIKEIIPKKKIKIEGKNKWNYDQTLEYVAAILDKNYTTKKMISSFLNLVDTKYKKITEIELPGEMLESIIKKMGRIKQDVYLQIDNEKIEIFSKINKSLNSKIKLKEKLSKNINFLMDLIQLKTINLDKKKNYSLEIKEFNDKIIAELTKKEKGETKTRYFFMNLATIV